MYDIELTVKKTLDESHDHLWETHVMRVDGNAYRVPYQRLFLPIVNGIGFDILDAIVTDIQAQMEKPWRSHEEREREDRPSGATQERQSLAHPSG